MTKILYDINKSFIDNWRIGPQIATPLPIRHYPPSSKWYEWLGFKIISRIGIPACPIMTSKGIALMSQLGFDIFTYKTIRSSAHSGHPWPNIKYVNIQQPLTLADINQKVYLSEQPPKSTQYIAVTNSFGNSSLLRINSARYCRCKKCVTRWPVINCFCLWGRN